MSFKNQLKKIKLVKLNNESKNFCKVKSLTKRFFVIDNSQENNPVLLLETENNTKTHFINKTFFPQWAESFKISN